MNGLIYLIGLIVFGRPLVLRPALARVRENVA
jgi:hypothetical protein